MAERLGAPISPVDAAMPKAFLEGYTRAISSVVPSAFMDQARSIVTAHTPEGVIPGTEPLCMAKVLVVEDTESWAKIYQRWSERAGHSVAMATSADEAKKLIESGQYDLIITDGLEDEWTGVYEAAQGKGTRTVVVSGSYSVEKESGRRGAEYIDKADSELGEKVQGILGKLK